MIFFKKRQCNLWSPFWFESLGAHFLSKHSNFVQNPLYSMFWIIGGWFCPDSSNQSGSLLLLTTQRNISESRLLLRGFQMPMKVEKNKKSRVTFLHAKQNQLEFECHIVHLFHQSWLNNTSVDWIEFYKGDREHSGRFWFIRQNKTHP